MSKNVTQDVFSSMMDAEILVKWMMIAFEVGSWSVLRIFNFPKSKLALQNSRLISGNAVIVAIVATNHLVIGWKLLLLLASSRLQVFHTMEFKPIIQLFEACLLKKQFSNPLPCIRGKFFSHFLKRSSVFVSSSLESFS